MNRSLLKKSGRFVPSAVSASSRESERPANALSSAEARRRLDEAVRRSWADLGRRASRLTLLILADTFAAVLAVIAVLVAPYLLDAGSAAPLWDLAPAFAGILLIQPFTLAAAGSYGTRPRRLSAARLVLGIACAGLLMWIQTLLVAGGAAPEIGGTFFIGYVVWASLLVFGGRLLLDRSLHRAHRHGFAQRSVVVVGSARETARIMRMLPPGNGADMRVAGWLLPNSHADEGTADFLAELEPALRTGGASEVIVAASELSFEKFEHLARRCLEIGVSVSVLPETLHRFEARLELVETRVGTALRLNPGGLGLPKLAVKRTIDVLLSVVGLIVLSPLLLLIALAIKLDSKGPVLFRQQRTGLGGQPFWMYKFRTMVHDADRIKAQLLHLNESGDPRLFKIKNDPRVTKLGRLLRATSLDELPQLLNVLAGEMSLIGPRPFFPEDLAKYADHHFERLSVLPGITGLWQVRGRSAVVDFEEVIRHDREYIHGWSLWLDLKILLLTLPAVVRRDGAY